MALLAKSVSARTYMPACGATGFGLALLGPTLPARPPQRILPKLTLPRTYKLALSVRILPAPSTVEIKEPCFSRLWRCVTTLALASAVS